MAKIYLVDASSFLYRAYFAIRNITNDKGESTNALYGFIRSLQKLIKDFDPTYLVSVFDGPNNIAKRKALYPQYKAHRVEMPADMRYQIDWAKQFCDLAGIPKLVIEGVEADDTMGSIATWGEANGHEVYLCSSDKDLCQLVSERVKILNTHKDNLILDPSGVEETYGVPPNKIIDLLAITGDSSDNVPGLSGFGPKTAVSLLQEFPSLEYILEHPEKVPGKKKQETIIEQADLARLSKKLVTIETDVVVPHELSSYSIQHPKLEELKDYYTSMNFNSLLKELETVHPEEPKHENLSYHLVNSIPELEKLIELLSKQKEVCFDTETTSAQPLEADLVGVGFSIGVAQGWYVPLNGDIPRNTVLERLKPLFENRSIAFFGQNAKYDTHVLQNVGICIKNVSFDTLLASYLLNSGSRVHSLDALSLHYFGKVKIPTSDLIGKGKGLITMLEVPIDKVSEYCCEDVDYTYRLKQILEVALRERKMEKLYFELELPLMKVLAKMERHGVFLDSKRLEILEIEIKKEILKLQQSIYALCGEELNLNSPKQLSEILFKKMGIPPPRKTSTGYSTAAQVLEQLRAEYPIAEEILKYRTLEKLRSTYIETLPKQISKRTGRIHTTYNQSIAATGRLSSQDPNLQNIPARSTVGREIREAFRPERSGWSFLSADYSQIELRLLAHLSNDPTLVLAFKENQDIHLHTAANIFGIPLEKVTKEMRQQAKAVNFGVIYGQQAFGLSQGLNIGFKEAESFIKMYFERYPKVHAYLEQCKENARTTGKAITSTGRERLIPEIHSKNPQIRQAAERLAVNTPIQGTSADLIKEAMLIVDDLITKEQKLGFMILQIHDELIFEIPDHEILAFETLVKRSMEGVAKLRVPLVVNISIGKNWGEC